MFKWLWRKLLRFWSTIPPQKEEIVPFTVVLVKRTDGSKRGIHATAEQIENVVKVGPSRVSPYINFDFEDGTKLSIHHDRLLEWRAHLK